MSAKPFPGADLCSGLQVDKRVCFGFSLAIFQLPHQGFRHHRVVTKKCGFLPFFQDEKQKTGLSI